MLKKSVPCEEIEAAARKKLEERGVEIQDIANIVYELQIQYNDALSIDECIENVHAVLKKREMQHAILVGIELDVLAEKGILSEPLQSIVAKDEPLFGVDETIAIGSVFGFGSIALTTFGYLDKEKIGIIKELDRHESEVHTFLDDLVASIAANAAARIAHKQRDMESNLSSEERKKREEEELIG